VMLFRCPQCGQEARVTADELPLLCVCDYLMTDPAELLRPAGSMLLSRAVRYVGAMAKAVVHRIPTRSDDEVESILSVHCKSCSYYHDGVCTHPRCGCHLNSHPSIFLNKIRAATEHCPIGKW